MNFIRELVVIGLLMVFALINISTSSDGLRSSHLNFLDWKCNISFDYSLFFENPEYSSMTEKYISCYNNTIDRMDNERFSMNERLDCFIKCSQIANLEYDEDSGIFNSNITNVITDQYEKYSNGTSSYINQVVDLMGKCATQARSGIQRSKDNGTSIGECELNGLYYECWWESLNDIKKLDMICQGEQK